jgi:DHA1 family multidrug resistance protein-like MFS transporter
MSLGIVIGPGIGGFLADYDLKLPLLISALMSLVSVIFSVVLKKVEKFLTIRPIVQEAMVKMLVQSVHKPYFIPLVITLVMSFNMA